QGLESGRAVVGRAGETVSQDCPNRAPRRNLRLSVAGQWRHLRQPIENFLLGFFVGVVVCELQLDVGKSEQRNRPHRGKVWNAGKLYLEGNGDVAFHFLRRLTGTLSDDIDQRWNGIR